MTKKGLNPKVIHLKAYKKAHFGYIKVVLCFSVRLIPNWKCIEWKDHLSSEQTCIAGFWLTRRTRWQTRMHRNMDARNSLLSNLWISVSECGQRKTHSLWLLHPWDASKIKKKEKQSREVEVCCGLAGVSYGGVSFHEINQHF